MAQPAYVILDTNGVVVKCHTPRLPLGGIPQQSQPTSGVADLESLILDGFVHRTVVPLDGGKVLVVLDKP